MLRSPAGSVSHGIRSPRDERVIDLAACAPARECRSPPSCSRASQLASPRSPLVAPPPARAEGRAVTAARRGWTAAAAPVAVPAGAPAAAVRAPGARAATTAGRRLVAGAARRVPRPAPATTFPTRATRCRRALGGRVAGRRRTQASRAAWSVSASAWTRTRATPQPSCRAPARCRCKPAPRELDVLHIVTAGVDHRVRGWRCRSCASPLLARGGLRDGLVDVCPCSSCPRQVTRPPHKSGG